LKEKISWGERASGWQYRNEHQRRAFRNLAKRHNPRAALVSNLNVPQPRKNERAQLRCRLRRATAMSSYGLCNNGFNESPRERQNRWARVTRERCNGATHSTACEVSTANRRRGRHRKKFSIVARSGDSRFSSDPKLNVIRILLLRTHYTQHDHLFNDETL